MSNYFYVPIVKGKSNDLQAVANTSERARELIKPLIELSEIESDTSVDNALRSFANRVVHVLPHGRAFVDLYALTPNATTSGGNATIAGFSMLAQAGRNFTPVYGFGLNDSIWPELSVLTRQMGRGFCFRVDGDDLDDKADETWVQIIERTADLRLRPRDVDILIDLRYMGESNVDELQERILDFLLLKPPSFSPRTYTVAGSSALKQVGGVPKNGTAQIVRMELRLWACLQAELAGTISLVFGDYGVVNPDFVQSGPNPNMNAKIRYTMADMIHYFRGSKLRDPPKYQQYHSLARRVVNSPMYAGADFSSGDRYIADCASKKVSTGNLGTWVRVDQNHHFEYTAKQVASLAEKVAEASSAAKAVALLAAP
jgi:hypothetical protein